MRDNIKIIAVIPAYKPSDSLVDVARGLNEAGMDVIVVDDGSSNDFDAVFDRAARYAKVLRYNQNRGKGEALKYGMKYALESCGERFTVVTADADGQHRIEDILKVTEEALAHPDALVLGSRVLSKDAPFKSRLGNGLTRFFYRYAVGRKVYETQTGLRAFPSSLIPKLLELPGTKYEFEMDMMLLCCDMDIREVDIETVYIDNNSSSHFRPFEDTARIHREFWLFKRISLISYLLDYLLFCIATLFGFAAILSNIASGALSYTFKFFIQRSARFSDKAVTKKRIAYFWLTAALLTALETLLLVWLSYLGVNIYIAKLLSGVVTFLLSVILRRMFGELITK